MNDFAVERIRQSVDFYFAALRPDLYKRSEPLSARFRRARREGADPLLKQRRKRRPRLILKEGELVDLTRPRDAL